MKTVVDSPLTALTERQAQAISALADGQLQGDELAQTLHLLDTSEQARSTWASYHLVGEVLRGGAVQATGGADFVQRLHVRLAQEAAQSSPQALATVPESMASQPEWTKGSGQLNPQGQSAAALAREPQQQAANDSFWKLVAGFASVVAVGALAWNLLGGLSGPQGAQLAQNSAAPVIASPANDNPNPNVVLVATPQGDMLRDARLVQMMTAHKQFGGVSGLQMPAGFLRNATFSPSQP